MTDTRHECKKVGLDFFSNAPIRIVSEVTLPCSPQSLFRCFEDAEAWEQWVGVIKKVEWTSALPFQAGTTRDVEMPGGMIAYEEFLVWDEPTHMAFRFNQFNRKFLKAFAEDYQVTDLGNDSCSLQWSVAIDPGMPLALIGPLLKPLLAGNLRRITRDLKAYMEGDGRKFCSPSDKA